MRALDFAMRQPITVMVAMAAIALGSIFAVTRMRTDVFPDPERFDPERFTPEAEAARPRSSYLPFGAGPRVCIGNHFALMEGPIVLLALSREIAFDIASGKVEPAPSATLRPAPVRATVRRRAEGARQAAE